MARALGIDYGTKRTGLSVTDPLRICVNALDTIETEFLKNYLDQYFSKNVVDLIVLGDPYHKDGNPTDLNPIIHQFGAYLKSKYPFLDIQYQDESNTSKQALKIMIEKGSSKTQRRDKKTMDKISAVIILQEYLKHY